MEKGSSSGGQFVPPAGFVILNGLRYARGEAGREMGGAPSLPAQHKDPAQRPRSAVSLIDSVARTLRGAARQMATAESALMPMAIQKASV